MTVALAHLSAKPMINLINFNNSWCPATVTHGFVEGCLLNNIHQLLFTNMEVADSKIVCLLRNGGLENCEFDWSLCLALLLSTEERFGEKSYTTLYGIEC
jgi:hypothetical protein